MRRWADDKPAATRQSGFTLLELVIVIILVMVLFATAMWRLLPLRGDAEAAHVAQTIGTLRAALGLAVTERIVGESLDSAARLEAVNPMTLLEQASPRYIGEVTSSDTAGIAGGSWYFHRPSRQLRYRVRYPQYLANPTPGERVELSWKVRLRYVDRDQDGEFEAGTDALRGIVLESLDNPQWPSPEENVPEVLEQT